MIAEFAVEPRVMAQWRHFQSLHKDFGVPRGRVICRYPSNWAGEVALLAHRFTLDLTNTPLNAKRIEEHLFGDMFRRKLTPARRPYDKSRPWLANAAGLEGDLAFHAIVAVANPANHPRVVVADDFLESDTAYHVEPGGKAGRTARELAACAKTLLKVSEELALVDPNFKVVKRFLETFEELLRLRLELRQDRPKKLELHLRRPPDEALDTVRHNFDTLLAERIPTGHEAVVFLWSQRTGGEDLHPRFLLTEYGGIKYDYGLDTGEQGEKTIVTVLPDSLWSELRQDYSVKGTTFDLDPTTDIFVVKGTRKPGLPVG